MASQREYIAPQGDRLMDLLSFYEKDKAVAVIKNPDIPVNDRYHWELERATNLSILDTYNRRSGLTPAERDTRRYMLHVNRRLDRLINPTPLGTILLLPIVQRLNNFLFAGLYGGRDKTLKETRLNTYRQENLDNLQQELRKAGFNISIEGKLKEMLLHNLKGFPLRYVDPKIPKTEFVLHFAKHPGTDAYYLEKFDAIRRETTDSVVKNDPRSTRQHFSMTGDVKFTAQEAANIANGRPVRKVNIGIAEWYAQDATKRTGVGRHFFDLEKELARWPIKDLQDPKKEKLLLENLYAGRTREVTFSSPDGKESKFLVCVRSDVAGLNFYSLSGQLIDALSQVSKNTNVSKLITKIQEKSVEPELSTSQSNRRHH